MEEYYYLTPIISATITSIDCFFFLKNITYKISFSLFCKTNWKLLVYESQKIRTHTLPHAHAHTTTQNIYEMNFSVHHILLLLLYLCTHNYEWKSVNRKNLLKNLSSFLFEFKWKTKFLYFWLLHKNILTTHTWLEHFSSMSMWNVRSHKYATLNFSFLYFQVSHINKTELTLCTSPPAPRPFSHYRFFNVM